MIKVGDKFLSKDNRLLEVTRTLPGGKVEMIDRANCYQTDKWTYQVREMVKVAA